jgi:NAD(P)-dependent dehydrogenase (short-subunit alcohol dehydrogenase family)
MNLQKLTNKTVVITGGGSGIGKSISILFARHGAKVYILEVSAGSGEETVDSIRKDNGIAKCYTCDVSDQAQVKQVIDQIHQETGSIDILVNNAGIAHIGNLSSTTEADFDKIYQVNVKGIYNCLLSCVEKMKQGGGGVILNMCSVAATVGIADRFAYSMSKGATLSMTLSVARDYINDNIRCNCISPGRVHTPFVDNFLAKNYPGQEVEMFEKLSKSQPIGRMGTPEEIAGLSLYLCSDEAAFITGVNYAIDGGFISLK